MSDQIDLVNEAIVEVDKEGKFVKDSKGKEHPYDDLVFATSARAFVPNIAGTNLNGVFRFRSLKNTEALLARTAKAREVVVIGSGILGVETAAAMSRFNTNVTLVHQAEHLLNRQLDESGAERLHDSITVSYTHLTLPTIYSV